MGGISKLVDRVEASGMCRRRPNPEDRRSSLIELTPAGRRRLAEATRSMQEELSLRIGDAVPPASLEQLTATVSAFRSAVRGDSVDELTG